jgi:hypothetical protein
LQLFQLLLLFILTSCNVAQQAPDISSAATNGPSAGGGKTVGFAVNSINGSEGFPTATFNIVFNHITTEITTIVFSFTGTAVGGASCVPGVDYVLPVANQIQVPSGVNSWVLDLNICSDTIYEGQETISASIVSTSPSLNLAPHAASVFLLNDSMGIPSVSFFDAATNVNEGNGGVITHGVDVVLSHASFQPISVVVTFGGSATYGTDYTVTGSSSFSRTINFAPGQVSQTIDVNVIGDVFIEPNEFVDFLLSNPFNASLGNQVVHTFTIQNDEGASQLSVQMNQTNLAFAEDIGQIDIPVDVIGVLDVDTTIQYTIDFSAPRTIPKAASFPSDFSLTVTTGATGTITIPAGTTGPAILNLPVTIVNDTIFEPDESFVVRLIGGPLTQVSPTPALNRTEVVILSDATDIKPEVSFASASQTLTESNTLGNILVKLVTPGNPAVSLAAGEPISITLTASDVSGFPATSPTDWTIGAMTVIIPEGQTQINIPIGINQDNIDEENERVMFTLSAVDYDVALDEHVITIIDADPPSKVSFETTTANVQNFAISETPFSIPVSLDKPSEKTITMTFTIGGSLSVGTSCVTHDIAIALPYSIVFEPYETTANITGTLCAGTYNNSNSTVSISSITNGSSGNILNHVLIINTQDPVIPTLTYDPDTVELSVDSYFEIEPTTLLQNGSLITNCAATPALPTGIGLDPVTCVISGVPVALLPSTTYTIVATNDVGNSLDATVTIEIGCPLEYILIDNGGSPFCVAKYEMRDDAGSAVSTSQGIPWINVSQDESVAACSGIGASYALISNSEWMAVAQEIESNDANWSGGAPGTGMLNRGHSDDSPSSVLAIDDDSDPYDGTGNSVDELPTVGWEQKRTHTLINGEIWDFAGNASEWVDWNVTPAAKAYFSADNFPVPIWREWTQIDENVNPGDEMDLVNWQAQDPSYSSLEGIGQYFAGDDTTGGAAKRGGSWESQDTAGIFSLDLSGEALVANPSTGFRCVWRP